MRFIFPDSPSFQVYVYVRMPYSVSNLISQGLAGDTNLPACAPCKDAGTKCVRGANVRFRNGLDLAEDHDVAFPESRTWPRLTGSSKFYSLSLACSQAE